MNTGKTIFSQLMDFLPLYELKKCVERYGGNRRIKTFTCLDQYLCMAFAQLTHRDSLRDIVTCLKTVQPKLYHSGIRGKISRSTLSDANESRDWRIYYDFAMVLINKAQILYSDDNFAVNLKSTVYALDSTTIDLCLSLFPWACFRKTKAAVKMHTLLDLAGNIPSFISVTTGKVHDVNILDEIEPEAGSFYVMDRAYNDFKRLMRFNHAQAFFVIRSKSNLDYKRVSSSPVNKGTGLRSDQTITLTGFYTSTKYPALLRRISFYDAEKKKKLVFITNNFKLSALTITKLYKCRWQVELFFKWIKQHLRIKSFYGLSENAVKTQIWIAISVYVLVAVVKKELRINKSLYEILQILDISIFEKTLIQSMFEGIDENNTENDSNNQLNLFGY